MIEPGLFRHYKSMPASPKLYRVLFVAPWWTHGAILKPDTPLYVAAYDEEIGVRTSPAGGGGYFMSALWSGNGDVPPALDELVVIYVALYGDGRVSVRSAKEFEERVDVMGGASVRRFERIGE